MDQLEAIIDPAGRVTKMEYDNMKRLIRKMDANGGVTLIYFN